VPTFHSLGVRPLINCRGTYTIISGSRALPEVVEAMCLATDHHVHMDELNEAVGERLHVLTGAEWGYVANGCAAALCELTCAAMAGGDPERMVRLPDNAGMPKHVIMQRGHRNDYDRAVRLAGADIIEFETLAQLRACFSPLTALVLVTGNRAHLGAVSVAEMIAEARAHGVISVVDAAAERPDLPNIYLQLGADAVVYSGGKCLRGPQASGLVLGNKALLQTALLNSAPHHGLARPMKAGKEEIMGLLAAIEAWVAGRDHTAEWHAWESWLAEIAAALSDLPTLTTALEQPGVANVAPMLAIRWNAGALASPAAVERALWEGEPRIALHRRPDGLAVMPYMMEPGDAAIAAVRLREVLSTLQPAAERVPEAPHIDCSGSWQLQINYVRGEGRYALALDQAGSSLQGTLTSVYATVPVNGTVEGSEVHFSARLGYQASQVTYCFKGRLERGELAGSVALGEYGTAVWRAVRGEAVALETAES